MLKDQDPKNLEPYYKSANQLFKHIATFVMNINCLCQSLLIHWCQIRINIEILKWKKYILENYQWLRIDLFNSYFGFWRFINWCDSIYFWLRKYKQNTVLNAVLKDIFEQIFEVHLILKFAGCFTVIQLKRCQEKTDGPF